MSCEKLLHIFMLLFLCLRISRQWVECVFSFYGRHLINFFWPCLWELHDLSSLTNESTAKCSAAPLCRCSDFFTPCPSAFYCRNQMYVFIERNSEKVFKLQEYSSIFNLLKEEFSCFINISTCLSSLSAIKSNFKIEISRWKKSLQETSIVKINLTLKSPLYIPFNKFFA